MSKALEHIFENMRTHGMRLTSPRKQLVEVLLTFSAPFTADDVLQELSEQEAAIHRATVYRDLLHLVRAKILKELIIEGSAAHYYELDQGKHHHHFVCKNCLSFIDVFPEKIEAAIQAYEKELTHSGLFIHSHALKFYGLCSGCKQDIESKNP